MTWRSSLRAVFLMTVIAALAGAAPAQQHSSQPQTERHQPSGQPTPPQPGTAQKAEEETGPGAELAEASREAAGEDETAEFKQSASVRWLASVTGLKPLDAYWIFVALNFAIIVALLVALMKSRVPAMFRARTETIQKSIEEARRASEEARRRLAEIESRLAKLDAEIAAMAASAEAEAKKEEARIQAVAEEDKNKIVQQADQEIVAAARLARTELRAYVSDLAVALAEKRIEVTPTTDQELVRAFVEQLGKNGK